MDSGASYTHIRIDSQTHKERHSTTHGSGPSVNTLARYQTTYPRHQSSLLGRAHRQLHLPHTQTRSGCRRCDAPSGSRSCTISGTLGRFLKRSTLTGIESVVCSLARCSPCGYLGALTHRPTQVCGATRSCLQLPSPGAIIITLRLRRRRLPPVTTGMRHFNFGNAEHAWDRSRADHQRLRTVSDRSLCVSLPFA